MEVVRSLLAFLEGGLRVGLIAEIVPLGRQSEAVKSPVYAFVP